MAGGGAVRCYVEPDPDISAFLSALGWRFFIHVPSCLPTPRAAPNIAHHITASIGNIFLSIVLSDKASTTTPTATPTRKTRMPIRDPHSVKPTRADTSSNVITKVNPTKIRPPEEPRRGPYRSPSLERFSQMVTYPIPHAATIALLTSALRYRMLNTHPLQFENY